MIFQLEADGRLLPGPGGLSAEQARALQLDRHVVVTAGAGSGKTRTLARRYLRILGAFAWRAAELAAAASNELAPGPEAIVVSTFTDRAAAEMKERIRAELVEGLRELRARGGELEGHIGPLRFDAYQRHLQRCLREFHRARIGTFHGFCAGLLREFAAAAALDPAFAVLTGGEAVELRAQAAEAALQQVDAGRADLRPLVDDPGRWCTRAALLAWMDKQDELRGFAATLEGDDEAVLAAWCAAYGGADVDALEAALVRLEPDLRALASFATGSFALGEAAQRALEALGSRPVSLAERGDRLRSCFAGFATRAGTLVRNLTGSGALPAASRKPAKAAWTALRAALEDAFGVDGAALDGLPGQVDLAALPVLRALSTLAGEAQHAYTASKEQRRALDFSDLQLRLRDLLDRRLDVVEALESRYEHVLVDEFQDTNALQWELVRRLLGDPLPDRGLFLVGDPKQAIYRFRGGDVTMFDQARDALVNVEHVSFTMNYRSRPPLIDAFNGLFGWLMPPIGSPHPLWEAAFEPLTAARQGDGAMELVWLEAGGGAEAEAAVLVDRLPALLEEHPAHKGMQVAILLRRRRHVGTFAAALRQAGVPHVVARGRGFFSRQEILDVADLLLALAHADDGVALLGALRGPFLALEDAWLLWLVRAGGRGPDALRRGWDGVLRSVHRAEALPPRWLELPAEGQAELLRAARDFTRWRELRQRLPLSALLRAVLDDTAAAALFAREDPTGQVVANLEKLLSLAVSFDSSGPEGLAEFGRHLREQDEMAVDEGEASLDATAPVVLMTIHQSKGLEFPVVVLPDVGSAMVRPITDRVAVGRLGADTVLGPTIELRAGQRERHPTMLRRLLRRQDAAEQRAESKRLLYVGCTRARERLLCLGQPSRDARGVDGSPDWQEWLRSWRDEAVLPAGVRIEDGAAATLEDRAAALPSPAPPERSALARVLAPLPRVRDPRVAPSDLATSELPAEPNRSPAGPPPSEPRALGLLRGRLVHECIEDGITTPGQGTTARVDHALASIGALDEPHQRWLHQELCLHLDGYRRAEPPPGLHEVPFQLPLGDGRWLRGAIDLLYRAPDRWVVLDYKSNRGDEAALVEHYRPQLIAYAWAASRILPEVRDGGLPVSAELLFTASGRRVQALPPTSAEHLDQALQAALPAPHAEPRNRP